VKQSKAAYHTPKQKAEAPEGKIEASCFENARGQHETRKDALGQKKRGRKFYTIGNFKNHAKSIHFTFKLRLKPHKY